MPSYVNPMNTVGVVMKLAWIRVRFGWTAAPAFWCFFAGTTVTTDLFERELTGISKRVGVEPYVPKVTVTQITLNERIGQRQASFNFTITGNSTCRDAGRTASPGQFGEFGLLKICKAVATNEIQPCFFWVRAPLLNEGFKLQIIMYI